MEVLIKLECSGKAILPKFLSDSTEIVFSINWKKFFVNDKTFVPTVGTYVSSVGTYVSSAGMYVSSVGTKTSPQRKYFYSTVLQQFKHYVSTLLQ